MIDSAPPGVPSPCIDVCRMDKHYEHCIGCYRTLDEIKRWSAMADAEKRTLLAALASRRTSNRDASGSR